MIIIYWVLTFLFSLLILQLFGAVWGIGLFLYCIFKQESVMAEAQAQPAQRLRTKGAGIGFIGALAFVGFFSLLEGGE